MDIPSPVDIVTKSVEISKSLVNTNVGMFSADLEITRHIGDLTRFSITLRSASLLTGRQLDAVSVAMKIPPREVKRDILPYMESEGMVEIEMDGARVKRIKVNIPPVEDLLKIYSKKWSDDQPSNIDVASIKALSLLSKRPYEEKAIVNDLGLDKNSYESMFCYGQSACYLGSFESEDKKKVVWTPLYWLDIQEEVEKYLKNNDSETIQKIAKFNEDIKLIQGIPYDLLTRSGDQELINAGIKCGFFPAFSINPKNEHRYVFASSPGFDDPLKDVFERARLIVACIRHGQFHAEGTRISQPLSVLHALKENRLKAHPHAADQYAILEINQIVTTEIDYFYGGMPFYKTRWMESHENNIAVGIAEKMLRGETTGISSAEEVNAQKILVTGVFNYSSEQRKVELSKSIVAKKEYESMMNNIRNVTKY